MRKGHLFFILFTLFLLTIGCDKISGLLNPFTGKWESGPFTLEFNTDKTFVFETHMGLTLEYEGTYKYDEEYLYLDFGESHQTEFSYKFNNDKSELSLTPRTKSKWFKATLVFSKLRH